MKKLIKPKGGREGRAQFITIGSMDIQEEPGDSALSSSLASPLSKRQQSLCSSDLAQSSTHTKHTALDSVKLCPTKPITIRGLHSKIGLL